MNAMTILTRCREAADDISKLEQRVERWYEILTGMSAPQADPNGGSRGSGDKDKTGRIMADIDQLQREIAARKEQENVEKAAAVALLNMVPELESKVLYDYYVKRWGTAEIAKKEKYTAGYVRKKKRAGEQLLEMLSQERVCSTLPAWYLKEKGGDK